MSNRYNISDFARWMGRAASKVRHPECVGLIKSKRLPSEHRSYDEDDVRRMLGKANEKRLTVIDYRVATHD